MLKKYARMGSTGEQRGLSVSLKLSFSSFYVLERMEQKRKRFQKAFAVFLVVVLALLIVAVYYLQVRPPTLYSGEITSYQGQTLTPITNVKENAIRGTQSIDATTYRLSVVGTDNRTVQFTYDQILTSLPHYQKVVTLHCIQGWSATVLWEGFRVTDLLKLANVNGTGAGVIFYAADGYSTELPLNYIQNQNIIIAYRMNNATIPPERGFPFELVAESQYGYKWIKWLTTIQVSGNPDYLGYWESRGLPNNATIPQLSDATC